MSNIRFSLFLCVLAFSFALKAEDVSFRAQAPSQVIAGKPFQLSYTVNKKARDLQAPDFSDFDYIAGPYQSQSSSSSFVNGKMSHSFTLTFTYTLMGKAEGTFTIQPATIRVDGETYTSNGVKITVLPADEPPVQSNSRSSQSASSSSQGGENISTENIFVRTIVTKTKVYEQEALLLTYKLYFAGVDVAQFTNNTRLPEFTGFLKQEIEQTEVQAELEHYNGRNYQSAVLYRTLLYPQHGGEIKIDPASFEAVLRVQVRQPIRSVFDDFFGSYTNVTKTIVAPAVTIQAQSLPAGKPSSFSGGVGQYTLSGNISSTEVKANEAVTIKLTIQGTGNLKLLKTPAIDWPEGFEAYDPKVNNQFKTTTAGMSGTKTIEYLAIPRSAGEYTVPAVSFSYFDTQSGTYKTESVGPWTLHIARSATDDKQETTVQNYTNKEDIRQLGTDIRYIHTQDLTYAAQAPRRTLSATTVRLCYLLPLLLAIVLFVVFRHQIRENADIVRVRYKKANKVAQKRLKEARQCMSKSDAAAFYEAIERAAWTYLSDRLSIPTAELNKENIASILRTKNVSEELIKEVVDVLSTAEFARYAPQAGQTMQELLDRTANLIDQLENQKL